jgi:NAD(P)-dependent dehydrogenase (short-subunit alcohol dehydrogenase family)
VTEPAQWSAAVARVLQELGGLDLVHLNAGITTRPPQEALRDDIFEWIDRGAYRRIMAVNVDGVVYGLRAVLPALEKRGGGSIVATASIAGLTGFPPDPFYTMSKHAVVGLVRSFAPALAAKGIRLNAICPGGVDTPLIPESFRRSGALLLMPARDLAAAVLDLLASTASGEAWVKGATRPAYRYVAPDVDLG